ncbi:MAG: TIGR04348 family glycosyltransferase [Rubrivivax sp.]|nr:TIGR04348 family glycosyltransferase [Rubrivivax sp.]
MCVVTPALASANNGNWQTASRWARWLSGHYRVRLVDRWDGGDDDLLIALHARRSAASVQAWREQLVARPLVVVLTGTDLYRDVPVDAAARRSLELADRLVVLQALGVQSLPEAMRAKAFVSVQSCSAWQPHEKTRRRLRALAVGHLRDEKDPRTYFEAARRLAARDDIVLDHIGASLSEPLAHEARETMAAAPNYRWLGGLPHGTSRARIRRAHVLVHMSRMEGGAHVVMEALRSGTPVLASRIDGNLGMLGDDWPALFEAGDAAGLAAALERLRDDPAMLADLTARALARAPLFDPARERERVLGLVAQLLETRP